MSFLAMTMMLLHLPFHRSAQTTSHSYRIPAWEIRVTRDRFTDERRCILAQGRAAAPIVSYAHGAVAFQFARGLNTTQASFKIDDGPARAWSSIYPELVETGAALEGRSLGNPTGGKVLLPLALLKGVHAVTIRPAPNRKPRLFSIDGLGDALSSASNLGCDPETGFGR